MKLFVGITDSGWFKQLQEMRPDEVNFWKPGSSGGFGVLQPGELFLFKLHSPNNFIVGGGHFVRFSRLPVSLAWEAFGEKNGVKDLRSFHERISKYRAGPREADPNIGCIVLSQPFFFDRDDWISAPVHWPRSTVQGKSYELNSVEGASILQDLKTRLGLPLGINQVAENRYGMEYAVRSRLGQGAFRVLVTEAYSRRCAITGEKTLPVLEAAHIRPFAEKGPNAVVNGVLLRADMHKLFDSGLISISPDHKILVSSQIEGQYTNGKLYYSYQGQSLRVLPEEARERPNSEFLAPR